MNVPNINIHGPTVNVGVNVHSNVSVNTNITANVNAVANANANASASASALTVINSSYYPMMSPPAATAITGLNVVGVEHESAYELVEEERSRMVEEWRVVRAVCVDDRGTPHPASRPTPDERVDAIYEGEIFRCMAGTAMQVTVGWRQDGADRWENAPTLMCRKGEALRHVPGGTLNCVTQEPRRNCNERSLLRMHGPGVKLIFIRREERYTETVRREVAREHSSSTQMTLMLDGGVGGYR